jgi:hypothetical protein
MLSSARRLMFSLATAALFGACVGSISVDPAPNQNDDDGDMAGGSSNRGGDGGTPTIPLRPEEAACPPRGALSPGPAPLRRLTRAEYNTTVLDLLNDASNPGDAFPPEATVHGFVNNVTTQAVTFTLADDYFKSAEQLATRAITKLDSIAPCDVAKMGEDACAKAFIEGFGRRAYRRPLQDDEKTALFSTYQKGRTSGDHRNGVKLVMTRMLASPFFLYRPEFGTGAGPATGVVALTPWETATRLSYLLWGTMPDAALFEAAAANQLSTDEQIATQAQRLLADPRAKPALQRFYSGWLMLDRLAQSSKDDQEFPGFGSLVPAMNEEITKLMDELLWEGTFGDLFTADHTFMNKALASFLSIDESTSMGATFDRVTLSPEGTMGPKRRMGILSTAGLLAAHSKPNETSPILRGKFVSEQILCMEVPFPPGDVPPAPAVDATDLTTRERFEQHSASECASCHKLMDPLGFAFEHFDAAGRFRATEKGKDIDASGILAGTDVNGSFTDSVGLSARLSDSQRVRACAARQWTRHALGREDTHDDARTLAQLSCGFRGRDARFIDLLTAFTTTDAFRYLPEPQGGQQ